MSCRCSSRNHNKLFTSVNNEDCKTLCECNIYPSICLSLNIIKLLDYISQISTSVRRCQMPVKVEWVASTSMVATSVCRRAPTSSSPTETRSPPPHNPPPCTSSPSSQCPLTMATARPPATRPGGFPPSVQLDSSQTGSTTAQVTDRRAGELQSESPDSPGEGHLTYSANQTH